MRSIVIGMGETGKPLWDALAGDYIGRVEAYDFKASGLPVKLGEGYDFMNICIPYSDKFIEIVQDYQKRLKPKMTVIHSTVPVGTTRKIGNAVHSPILGRHGRMLEDLRTYPKWIGGEGAEEVSKFFEGAHIRTNVVKTPEETELLKLMCLAKYGMSIAFAIYQKRLCDQFGISYDDVHLWDTFYNDGVMPSLKRPLIEPPKDGAIGGHCVVPGTKILNDQFPDAILGAILRNGEVSDSKIWGPSNVYPSAKIGKNVNIGAFSEIGANVVVGSNVRIGAMSFLPEGLIIEDDVFLGPRFTGTNDRYPPSSKENWLKTTIKRGARVGAAVTVLPGVTIFENALIGAGSVVTRDVPAGERWAGVPARKIEHKEALNVR